MRKRVYGVQLHHKPELPVQRSERRQRNDRLRLPRVAREGVEQSASRSVPVAAAAALVRDLHAQSCSLN